MVFPKVISVNKAAFARVSAEWVFGAVTSAFDAGVQNPTVCWPVGDTQMQAGGLYDVLVRDYAKSFSNTRIVQLDEAEGLTYFRDALKARVQQPLGINGRLCSYFDGAAGHLDLQAEIVAEKLRWNPLDVFVGGLGTMDAKTRMGAHVGYNEAGSSPNDDTRVVDLSASSLSVLEGYGGVDMSKVTGRAITVGLKEILNAKVALMMVSGAEKAEVLRAVLHDQVSSDRPASFLRGHDNMTIIAYGEASAGLVQGHAHYDLVRG
jgi:glucosamine-6-phosphate deaminase